MTTHADARGRLAAAQNAAAAAPVVSLLGTPPPGTPDGFSAWAVGQLFGPRHIIVVPTLAPDAPPVIVDRLVAHVIALATGACPLCGAVAGLVGPEPIIDEHDGATHNPAAWTLQPLTVGIRHVGECPGFIGAADAHWFPIVRGGER